MVTHHSQIFFYKNLQKAKVSIVIKREVKFGWLMKLTFTSPVSSMEIFDAQVAQVMRSHYLVNFNVSSILIIMLF